MTAINEKLADNFFAALGWDIAEGVPSRDWLERLGGLDNVVRDLY